MATVWAFVDNREVCASWGRSLHGSRSGVVAWSRAVWSRGGRAVVARWSRGARAVGGGDLRPSGGVFCFRSKARKNTLQL